MSQMANITVFDGAVTPVSHTLTAIKSWVEPDLSTKSLWRENNALLPKVACITFTLQERVLKSGVTEQRGRLDVPVMESVAGVNAQGYTAAAKVAYVDSYELVSRKHPRSTILGQRIAKQMMTNLMANVATTVPAVTAGLVDEAFAQSVQPT